MGSTNDVEHYALISLGSGEAGKYIAWTEASKGKRCAVVERRWLGGSCPNVACLPSKNVIHSAKLFSSHGDRLQQGYQAQTGQMAEKADMRQVKIRKDDMVTGLMTMHNGNFNKNHVDVIWGNGKFVGPKQIEVTDTAGNTRNLGADVIIVCTGSRAKISDVPGLREVSPLTHVEMLDIEEVPDHLIILGGGYIGLEFAQAMRRFGAKVTVIEHNSRVLKREDEDTAAFLRETLENEGVFFLTNTSISSVSGKSGQTVVLKGTNDGETFEMQGSHILCATGRLPNTEDIGSESAGLSLNANGHIEVDEWNRATEDGVFAVGDCAGSPHFTHVAFDDYRIVREYLNRNFIPDLMRRSSRQVPFTLFTDPEFAHVGLREHEAGKQDIKYRLAKLPMAAFLKTRTLGSTEGFAKLLVAQDSDIILGFSAIGSGAGELLPVIQLAMKKDLPYTDIGDLVITHPTLSEGLVPLCGAVPPKL